MMLEFSKDYKKPRHISVFFKDGFVWVGVEVVRQKDGFSDGIEICETSVMRIIDKTIEIVPYSNIKKIMIREGKENDKTKNKIGV